jgi:translation initiation factor 2B subunit (eIF-2B alpha/beta/delta family)
LEETTLSVSEDIHLLRRGKPFSFIDHELRTKWTVYPFAWELQPGAKPIKLDWEHTEVKFVKPVDLDKYDHVPLLEVGMHRVLVGDEIEMGLQELERDHESGAQALAVKALEILLNSVQKGDLSKLRTTEDFWRELRGMAWHLAKNGRPSMAAAIETQLFKALETMRNKMEASTKQTSGTLPINEAMKIAKEAIEARIAAQKHTLEKLAQFFVDFIESRLPVHGRADQPRINIVTLSSSGTITRCLSNLTLVLTTKGFNVSLSVLESRPNFEGISFVNALLSALPLDPDVLDKLTVDIVSDASMATVTRNAHYLVLGGDKVLPTGDVSNKIGTLSTAIVAKTINPKCHVIATFDTSKITTSSFEGNHDKVEYNDEAEMIGAWPKELFEKLKEKRKLNFKVEVKNAYFEWVTAGWIDTYISEEGVLSVQDIDRLGKQSKELEDTVFSDF